MELFIETKYKVSDISSSHRHPTIFDISAWSYYFNRWCHVLDDGVSRWSNWMSSRV